MKFLVDAQLPQSFCGWLQQSGHDARHTIHLPNGNRTTDQALVDIADRKGASSSPRTRTSSNPC